MQRCRRVGLRGRTLLLAALSCLPWSAPAQQQEIAPFRLTAVEGFLALRYLDDVQRTGAPGTAKYRDSLTIMEEELFILTRSYVYHPAFLNVDFGVGPLFVQTKAQSGDLSNRDRNTLYNLTTSLNFLDAKAYPFRLYYDHLNPTVTTSVAQSFVTETNRIGANFSLRQPLSPVLVNLDVYQLTTQGEGITDRIDETIQQETLRMSHAIGRDGYNDFSLSRTEQDSRSGSTTLPIVPTRNRTDTATLDTRLRLGAARQGSLTSYLSTSQQTIDTQDTDSVSGPIPGERLYDRKDVRWTPDLRWDHNAALQSFYRYNYYDAAEQNRDTTNHGMNVGLNYRPDENVTATAEARGQHNRTTGLTEDARGASATLRYRIPLDEQTALDFNVGLAYDYRDRESPTDRVDISNESVQFVGLAPVTLSQDFIDINTIRVFNQARTQEYCRLTPVPQPAGCTTADYEVIVIGSKTQLVRIVGGAIADGQFVVVDYTFQAGGTVAYTVLGQTYRATLFFLRYFQAFARYYDVQNDIVSGTPTLPLNDITNTWYGVRADYPFYFGWMVGGEANLEYQREDISPYDRQYYDAYVQMMLPLASSLRLSARRTLIDYLNSSEDVDARGYSAFWRARPWSRTTLTVEYIFDEDRGGSIPREYQTSVLGFEWRYRQFGLRAEARYTLESQAESERDRTVLRFIAQRNF